MASRSTPPTALPTMLPILRPGTPVVVRPGNRVVVGCDPDRSLLFDITPPVTASAVASLLRDLQSPRAHGEVVREARSIGLTRADLADILDRLRAADKTMPGIGAGFARALRVGIHGRGPLTGLLATSLDEAGIVTRVTAQRSARTGTADGWDANLVLLTDFLVHDPTIVQTLVRARIPHLQVRVRDGIGLVGPLVLPGLSSCLNCADHHRTVLDPGWPLLAAQLLRRPGYATSATIRTTAALAQEQVEQIAMSLYAEPRARTAPQLVDQVVEFHPSPARLLAREWPPHPLCDCRESTLPLVG